MTMGAWHALPGFLNDPGIPGRWVPDVVARAVGESIHCRCEGVRGEAKIYRWEVNKQKHQADMNHEILIGSRRSFMKKSRRNWVGFHPYIYSKEYAAKNQVSEALNIPGIDEHVHPLLRFLVPREWSFILGFACSLLGKVPNIFSQMVVW